MKARVSSASQEEHLSPIVGEPFHIVGRIARKALLSFEGFGSLLVATKSSISWTGL
jgi:hypothetical protein